MKKVITGLRHILWQSDITSHLIPMGKNGKCSIREPDSQSVKFDMSDSDIIDMVNRVAVHAPEIGYDLDMDGKTWCNEGNGADIEICQSTEGQSAQELFDAYGKREFSEEGLSWLTAMPSTGQASRYLTAYQKKNNAEGYYIVHIGQNAEVTGTLTVPMA